MTVAGALAWWLGTGPAPLLLAALSLALVGAGVMAAWARDGRRIVRLRELLALPLYVAAKLPIYLLLFGRRQVEWVRTSRDERRP